MRARLGSPSALTGIALTLGAVAMFAALDTTTKLVLGTVPLMMALWFRYFFQAVASTLVMLPRKGWSIWRTQRPGLQVLRGLLLVSSSLAAFEALRHISVAEFTAIVSLGPLLITVIAALLFSEAVSRLRWLLVLGGFAGALLIIKPGGANFSGAALLPLIVLTVNAGFQLLTSRMVRTEDPMTMQLYTGWTGTAVASLALPWAWTALSLEQWGLMMLMGLTATIGHFLLTLAYERTAVATMAPYMYAQIAFAVIAGWLVFSHTPDGESLVGMSVIAACGAGGAWLTMRQARIAREALAQPAVPS
ncbi:MAG: DMT family transporter [Betaproteobacteria bacterium]